MSITIGGNVRIDGLIVAAVDPYDTTVTFTSNTSWTAPRTLTSAYVTLVGGGGGAGSGSGGGGGGGGGMLANVDVTANIIPGTTYTITVGAGGVVDANGGNTSAFSLTAVGGGHGGNASSKTGADGGSGGGGSGASTPAGAGGSPTSGQGYAGGIGFRSTTVAPFFTGGGGGGAGGVGGAAGAGTSGGNGLGKIDPIAGGYYSFGGIGTYGTGTGSNDPATNNNTGYGGNGSSSGVNRSGGDSGKVILKYRSLGI